MFKKFLLTASCFLFVLFVLCAEEPAANNSASVAPSSDASAVGETQSSTPAVEKIRTIGFVVSIDENNVTIVDDSNNNHTYKIEKSTKFIDANKGNGLVPATEITVDERVGVDVKKDNEEVAYQVVQLITDRVKQSAQPKETNAADTETKSETTSK